MVHGGGSQATSLRTSATSSVNKFLTILNVNLLQIIELLISSLREIGSQQMSDIVKTGAVDMRPRITSKRKRYLFWRKSIMAREEWHMPIL